MEKTKRARQFFDSEDDPLLVRALRRLQGALVQRLSPLLGETLRWRPPSKQEIEFRKRVRECVPKPEGHAEKYTPLAEGARRLYAVTTLAASARFGGTRTPVVCDDFQEAKHLVEKNVGDLFEASYLLAVIEVSVANSLYSSLPGEQYWYRWEGDTSGGYKPIEVPPGYENITGFGIG